MRLIRVRYFLIMLISRPPTRRTHIKCMLKYWRYLVYFSYLWWLWFVLLLQFKGKYVFMYKQKNIRLHLINDTSKIHHRKSVFFTINLFMSYINQSFIDCMNSTSLYYQICLNKSFISINISTSIYFEHFALCNYTIPIHWIMISLSIWTLLIAFLDFIILT